MDIFISQSGELSRQIAIAFKEWIPCIFQQIKTFISEDIEKGDTWNERINAALETYSHCFVFLTKENLRSPWLHFEAGKISKIRDRSKVYTVLINLRYSDVEQPLSMFQHTMLNKDDIYKLLDSINNNLETPLTETMLKKMFEKWWSELDATFTKILSENPATPEELQPRNPDDMIVEILGLTRTIVNQYQQSDQRYDLLPLCNDLLNYVKNYLRFETRRMDRGSFFTIFEIFEKHSRAIQYILGSRQFDAMFRKLLTNRKLYLGDSEVLKDEGYYYSDELMEMRYDDLAKKELAIEIERLKAMGTFSPSVYTKEQLAALDLKQRQAVLGVIPSSELIKDQLSAKLGVPEIQKMQDAALAGASLHDEVIRKQAIPGIPPMQDSISQQMKEYEATKLKDAYSYDKAAELSRQNELDKMAQKPDIRLSQQLKQEMAMPTSKEMIEEKHRNEQQAKLNNGIPETMTDRIKDLDKKKGFPPK